ncbi:hypothetical protein [Oleiagrimonas sp. C23AA]|uniref:hypothetical protein n=1 Tax=Oleiagrimonas sp. C23AA TaxID=2719047 RepID=UPI00141FAEBB|nr:hypothetical protein [Oleiagrimonas sp. C23AA]NII10653.1 hypothetical protein [Oleiagrimonas sp. C23AA]
MNRLWISMWMTPKPGVSRPLRAAMGHRPLRWPGAIGLAAAMVSAWALQLRGETGGIWLGLMIGLGALGRGVADTGESANHEPPSPPRSRCRSRP